MRFFFVRKEKASFDFFSGWPYFYPLLFVLLTLFGYIYRFHVVWKSGRGFVCQYLISFFYISYWVSKPNKGIMRNIIRVNAAISFFHIWIKFSVFSIDHMLTFVPFINNWSTDFTFAAATWGWQKDRICMCALIFGELDWLFCLHASKKTAFIISPTKLSASFLICFLFPPFLGNPFNFMHIKFLFCFECTVGTESIYCLFQITDKSSE